MATEIPGTHDASRYRLTAEQLQELAWRVAGATMASLGVAREDLPYLGKQVEPAIEELIRDYLVVISELE
jgi:hypothetical protein